MFDEITRRMVLRGTAALASVIALGLPANAQTTDALPQSADQVPEMALGDPQAPVTMIEYASLTCPHCAAFHREVFPQLKEKYIDGGQVRFIAREVFFDRPGLWGAMVARCAGEDRYFGVLDLLYRSQDTWSRAADAPSIVEGLYGIGRQAGLTRERMDACLSDSAFAQALVTNYQENATADGVDSTPTFIINGEKVSNRPWPELEAIIKDALAG